MKIVILVTALMLFGLSSNAQSIQIKDLSKSMGNWKGKLTYLDYSTGNPYTMESNIKISLTKDKRGYIMGYEYPDEPQANSKDTTYLVDKLFGKEKIVEFKKSPDGGFAMVCEKEGVDGNDQKKAMIRHTYVFKSNFYTITKEVKFDGADIWIKRNEYVLTRMEN